VYQYTDEGAADDDGVKEVNSEVNVIRDSSSSSQVVIRPSADDPLSRTDCMPRSAYPGPCPSPTAASC